MSEVHSFPPIAAPDATRLILGTMPGLASLAQGEYYAHPRNGFWPLMQVMLGAPQTLDYSERCLLLIKHRIALWDVLQCCERKGSLDSAIEKETMQPNDFSAFLAAHPHIKQVFFNGQPAARLWQRLVMPTLAGSSLQCHVLPSTSPAHAALSLAEKTKRWHIVSNEQ